MSNKSTDLQIKTDMDQKELLHLLTCQGEEEQQLYTRAAAQRNQAIGNGVHLRGLIEISNICRKNCLYCGIRHSNPNVNRYELTDEEILEAARFAWQHNYGSVVLQGGERTDKTYVNRITRLLQEIKRLSNNQLGITLSLGEQDKATYQRWFEAGAHRYLLRIETSNSQLYRKIHPADSLHDFATRLQCLEYLQECGYQTGSGVMIGLPFQTTEDLVNDLLFLKSIDIDMVGMGPYLEHQDTPLYSSREVLLPISERLRLSLHMVAALRLMIPDINIAATTALQAIDSLGREKALAAGANVIMPNITPESNRKNYKLYSNKPFSDEGAEEILRQLIESCASYGCRVNLGEWGDSRHWHTKNRK
ncbi:[FeFe] hydrogenase H-cluster radical SAM maturase HydE [Culturomica massiliensis]|uniref:[FeFe] hydrogenase H-cluster radical SAM maturase HydE n=1 Tax=Culturomica massiliensis TaxID=1841857 RepID=UPI0021CBF9CA|nr:[FeFe] hydrogenase H-cluster radical SAM maturase HydE [Culturomica massiliensis]